MALPVNQKIEPFALMDITSRLIDANQEKGHWSINAVRDLAPEGMECDWESPENWMRFWQGETKLWVHRDLPLILASLAVPRSSFWPSCLQIIRVNDFDLQCLTATEESLIIAFGDVFPRCEFDARRFSAYDLWFHTVT